MKSFISDHNNIGLCAGWAPQTVTYTDPHTHGQNFPIYLNFVKNNPDEYLAIGEIGLDFHHAKTLEQRKKQSESFKKIIHETKFLGKPYVLHIRNAGPYDKDPQSPNHPYNEKDAVNKLMIQILEEEHIAPEKVMWHCFSGPQEWGPMLAEQGYMLSVPSSAYGFKRWRNNTTNVPVENLFTETDSHFQHPLKIDGYNVPLNVKYSVAAIAYTHNISQNEIADQIITNAAKFFDLRL